MSLIPLPVLLTPPTSDQLFEKALAMFEAAGVPARSWRVGSVARTLLSVGCELGGQGAAMVSKLIAGLFLEYATGDLLTAHAKDAFDVARIGATFATGSVTLTNSGGANYSVGADELVVKSSSSGARYRVTEAFALNAGSTVTVDVQALEIGDAASVGPDELDGLETPLAKVTVRNESAIIGRAPETDAELRERCRRKPATWSPFGPRDAYEYAALSATLPDGSPTNITRATVSRYSSTGRVAVVCATPSGAPTTAEIDAAAAAVERTARADCVTASVAAATPHAAAHSIRIWCKGGVAATVEERASAAVASLIAGYPIGGISKVEGGQGYLYADRIAAAIIGANAEAFDVDFLDGGDVALGPSDVVTHSVSFEVRIT